MFSTTEQIIGPVEHTRGRVRSRIGDLARRRIRSHGIKVVVSADDDVGPHRRAVTKLTTDAGRKLPDARRFQILADNRGDADDVHRPDDRPRRPVVVPEPVEDLSNAIRR